MNQPQTEELELNEVQLLAKYVALLIEQSDYSQDEQLAWLAVLPFMKLDQVIRLATMLQEQVNLKVNEEFPEIREIDQIISDYNERQSQINTNVLSDLDKLEAEIEKELIA